MRSDKRLWIYSGMGVPDGVALVRPHLKPLPHQDQRILVGGGALVPALLPLLAKFAKEEGAQVHVEVHNAPTRTWAREAWLAKALDRYRPHAVMLVLDPTDVLARHAIRGRVRRHGGKVRWLVPPGVAHQENPEFVSAPGNDVRSLAIWAANAWKSW